MTGYSLGEQLARAAEENADLRGQVGDLEAELRYLRRELECAQSALTEACDEADAEIDELRRLLLDETYRPEGGEIVLRELRQVKRDRDALAETLQAARDYVDHQWGRAEQAAEQVRRIDSAGVALAFADLAAILGSDQ